MCLSLSYRVSDCIVSEASLPSFRPESDGVTKSTRLMISLSQCASHCIPVHVACNSFCAVCQAHGGTRRTVTMLNMQAPPPPPPLPGHHGTYRVPCGVTTRAARLQHHQHPPTSPLPTPSFPPQLPSLSSFHATARPRTYQTPPLPNDFVTSPDFHDCRVILGTTYPNW